MASKKVKAGTKLLIAEERVGELKLMPVYPTIWDAHLQFREVLIKSGDSQNHFLHVPTLLAQEDQFCVVGGNWAEEALLICSRSI